MKTQEEIVRETIEFYQTHPRSVNDENGGCLYLGENGAKCAFSRICKDDEETQKSLGRVEGQSCYYLVCLLKEEYSGYEPSFYKDLQILHDCEYHWDEQSPQANVRWLTQRGKDFCKAKFKIVI